MYAQCKKFTRCMYNASRKFCLRMFSVCVFVACSYHLPFSGDPT